MKCYRIYVAGYGSAGLTMAPNRAKAIYRSYAEAREAGFCFEWIDFRALRAPEFDWAFEKYGAFNWSNEHAAKMLKRYDPPPQP